MILRKPILAAGLVCVALASAAPAYADDALFVDALDLLGITIDPATAVAMGHSICGDFDAGRSLPAVVERLSAEYGFSAEDASLVAGFSVAEYCDHNKESLHDYGG